MIAANIFLLISLITFFFYNKVNKNSFSIELIDIYLIFFFLYIIFPPIYSLLYIYNIIDLKYFISDYDLNSILTLKLLIFNSLFLIFFLILKKKMNKINFKIRKFDLNLSVVLVIFISTFFADKIFSNIFLNKDVEYYGEIYKIIREANFLNIAILKVINYVNFFSMAYLIVFCLRNYQKNDLKKKIYKIIILVLLFYFLKNINFDISLISKSDLIFFWYFIFISYILLNKLKFKTYFVTSFILFASFIALSIVRTYFTEHGRFDIFFGFGEFITIHQNALFVLSNPNNATNFPIFQSVYGVLNFLPNNILFYEKISFAEFFMKQYFPSQYEAGFGRGFGLAAQIVIEGSYFALFIKSFILAFIFSLIPRFNSKNSNNLSLTLYVIFGASIFMIFRNHSFANIEYLLQVTIYFFMVYFPILILIKFYTFIKFK